MPAMRRFGVLLIAMLLSVVVPDAALAEGSRTVYVDDTGTANAAQSGRCGHPNYAAIQAAVDDLSASRIVVCRGTYTEQVSVTRSLTLEGRSGAVIQAPAVLGTSGALVSFSGPQESRLRGFTISGASTTDQRLGAGVSVGDGARVTIAHNRIHDIRGVSLSFTSGSGIAVDGGWADITDNRIERYGNQGVILSGSGTFAMIDDNVIRSAGASGPAEAQIGMNIREGAAADVEDNTVSGNTSDFYADGNFGIVVDQTAHVSIRDNIVTGNQLGIVLGDEVGDTEVRSNEIRNNTSHGLLLIKAGGNTVVENESSHNGGDGIMVRSGDPPATDNRISSNKVRDNKGNGISLGAGAVGNTVTENRAFNNHGFDIADANGGPPANVYKDNKCKTSSPDGLCED